MRRCDVAQDRLPATGNSKIVQVFGLALGTLLFALSFSAEAQQPKKVTRIGFLTSSSASDPLTAARIDAFRQGLNKLVSRYVIALTYHATSGLPV